MGEVLGDNFVPGIGEVALLLLVLGGGDEFGGIVTVEVPAFAGNKAVAGLGPQLVAGFAQQVDQDATAA